MPAIHQARAARGQFCETIFPNPSVRLWSGAKRVHLQHRLICCDCGLSHRNGKTRMVRVAPKSYTIQFRARRNERSTAQVRRKKQARPRP